MDFNVEVFQSTLVQGLQDWGLTTSEQELRTMVRFAELIIETNQTLNLTRLVEPEEMAVKNFLDSLSCLRLELPDKLSCLDLGTGAGFPGVPLALVRPGWSMVLLDSLRKRLGFLDKTLQELGLTNCSTLHARAEDVGQKPQHRESYDLVVSRAVASLPVLLELCTPLVKVGGCFVAYKSSEGHAELDKCSKVMKVLGLQIEQVFHFQLPLSMGERNLLVLRKEVPTPRLYPRRAGLPNKHPLE